MRDIRVAKRYADAIYSAAVEAGVLDNVIEDVISLQGLIRDSDEFNAFLQNLLIVPESKQSILQELLGNQLDPLVLNALFLLVLKKRERSTEDILLAFTQLVDEQAGRLVADVTSAIELTSKQQDALVEKLSGYSGKQVRLSMRVDSSIKGGFIAKLGDTVFDGSVATQLQRLKRQLARG
ncbi:MAG: ATP synthase F1 subunit delta [Candidatus Poribacteria bacterium]|nr:ATP synthase F1 subunit delta [Candidatus Poribacteria bacterium]